MALTLQVSARDTSDAGVYRHQFDRDRTQVLIGRRVGVDVLLPDANVSLMHARIERSGDSYQLADERSTNGTYVNGVRLSAGQPRSLANGDRIVIGRYQLEVSFAPGPGDFAAEASSSLARRMVEELLERLGPGAGCPALRVLDGSQAGAVLRLDRIGSRVLGRTSDGELRLDEVDPARERALLQRSVDGVSVRAADLGSPLLVNGEPLAGARPLADADLLSFAGASLKYVDPAEVYLRKLSAAEAEVVSAPSDEERARDDQVDRATRTRPGASPRRARAELFLAVSGIAIALAALAALIALLSS
jgi:hypothetical protein